MFLSKNKKPINKFVEKSTVSGSMLLLLLYNMVGIVYI